MSGWNIEQQHKSSMGELRWLKVAGPFESRELATRECNRRDKLGGHYGLRIVLDTSTRNT